MNKLWVLIPILTFALSGCMGTNTEPAAVALNATPIPVQTTIADVFPVPELLTVYVTIKGTMFNPPELEITNGTTVKWTNEDSVEYIINVSGTLSPLLTKKKDWSYTFNKTGIYEYRSDLHPSMPHGRIIVN